MAKKMTGAEILKQDAEEQAASVKAMMEETAPKTPLEAAIDRATGYAETEKPDSETEKPDSGTEKPKTGTENRDWVDEAVQCFIKDVKGLDPTDPVNAIKAYFQKNATDELKARCKAEGKDAKGCWRFIEAVARKALGNRSGHIDPSAIYAIAMHWFEDVPADWDKRDTKPVAKASPKTKKPKKPAETPSEIRKEKERKAKAAKPKAKKSKEHQGFFFELLETPTECEVKK